HGWTQHSGCWDGVCALLPTDVRVVRMDLRGHGGSDPARRGARTLEQLADDLAELLAARTTGLLVLVGHSMGGMTLMALAERHPYVVSARVAGMAFVATSSGNMHRISLGLRGALGRSVPRVEPVLRGLLERRENGSLPAVPQVLSPVVRWLVFGRRAPRGGGGGRGGGRGAAGAGRGGAGGGRGRRAPGGGGGGRGRAGGGRGGGGPGPGAPTPRGGGSRGRGASAGRGSAVTKRSAT